MRRCVVARAWLSFAEPDGRVTLADAWLLLPPSGQVLPLSGQHVVLGDAEEMTEAEARAAAARVLRERRAELRLGARKSFTQEVSACGSQAQHPPGVPGATRLRTVGAAAARGSHLRVVADPPGGSVGRG